MASHSSLGLTQIFYYTNSFGLTSRGKTGINAPNPSRFIIKEQHDYLPLRKNLSVGMWFRCYTSSRWFSSWTFSSSASSAHSNQTRSDYEAQVSKTQQKENEFNRVQCLVWVLHESARSFSLAVESLEVVENGPELAMSWIGKDVHQWHKRIAYRVAVYALMKTAIDLEILLSQERCNDSSPVRNILTPKTNLVGEDIESQLSMKHPVLVEWFRVIELPRIAGFFIPLLKKWSMEYAGSGVAGIVVAMSCCAAVRNLCSRRKSSPFAMFDDIFVELMDISYDLVSVDKLHSLSIEAGFELDFLSHFGKKVVPNKKSEELEFWIGLAQEKLTLAFQEESAILGRHAFLYKVQAHGLATLGLFAYLGRRTRLFLSRMGIKDLDEQVIDFLSHLECGSVFIYPELSSVQAYQLFMEIVADEIGWLDIYAAFHCVPPHERKSKQHAIQAEKEIILSTVFTTCYDVFSGFAHLNRSTQQPLDAHLLAFLLRSQSLLTICLEDYWAAYDKSSIELKIAEAGAYDPKPSEGLKVPTKLSIALEAQQKSRDLMAQGYFIRQYCIMLASTSSDVWMGTQLLIMDFMVALELLGRQLRGHTITLRERKKLKGTLNDIASLVPMTILMLLPVSAVGHAAILAAIKKYMPQLIPSPYSLERLDIVKQLKRTKKMEVQSWINLEEDPSSWMT